MRNSIGWVCLAIAALAVAAGDASAQTEIQWWHAMTGANNDVIVNLAKFNASRRTTRSSRPQGRLSGHHERRHRRVPRRQRPAHHAGIRGRHRHHDVGDRCREAGARADEGSGWRSTPRSTCRPSPATIRRPRARCSPCPSIRPHRHVVQQGQLQEGRARSPTSHPRHGPRCSTRQRSSRPPAIPTAAYGNAWVTWVNLEQLSPGDAALGTKANGMDGWDTVLKLQQHRCGVEHLENLVELQKDGTLRHRGAPATGEGRFTSGECADLSDLLRHSSATSGPMPSSRGAMRPMPYYPGRRRRAQNPSSGGLAVGHGQQERTGTQRRPQVLPTFLSDTDRQVELHKKSGYLPITKAAYAKTKAVGYYKETPYLETPLLELTNKEPTENSRGCARRHGAAARRVGRGVRGRAVGKKTPRRRSTRRLPRQPMLRQFERVCRSRT